MGLSGNKWVSVGICGWMSKYISIYEYIRKNYIDTVCIEKSYEGLHTFTCRDQKKIYKGESGLQMYTTSKSWIGATGLRRCAAQTKSI